MVCWQPFPYRIMEGCPLSGSCCDLQVQVSRERNRLAPTSPATFGIYLQKMCLFSERGDLIFARHGTVLASKAKREAPTEAVGCMLSVGRKGKIGIVDLGVDHAQFYLGSEI